VNGFHACIPQHPPSAGRGDSAAVVVSNHGVAVVEPPAPRGKLEALNRGKGMPAQGRLCVVREFAGQVHENRSWQVAFQVLAVPIRPAQDPTHVQEHGAEPKNPLLGGGFPSIGWAHPSCPGPNARPGARCAPPPRAAGVLRTRPSEWSSALLQLSLRGRSATHASLPAYSFVPHPAGTLVR